MPTCRGLRAGLAASSYRVIGQPAVVADHSLSGLVTVWLAAHASALGLAIFQIPKPHPGLPLRLPALWRTWDNGHYRWKAISRQDTR